MKHSALSYLGAADLGLGRDAVGAAGARLRPWEFVVPGVAARVGSDKQEAKNGAWFDRGVYSAAEVVDTVNRDAIGVRARLGADWRVEVEEL